jgi:hypothetical protein
MFVVNEFFRHRFLSGKTRQEVSTERKKLTEPLRNFSMASKENSAIYKALATI